MVAGRSTPQAHTRTEANLLTIPFIQRSDIPALVSTAIQAAVPTPACLASMHTTALALGTGPGLSDQTHGSHNSTGHADVQLIPAATLQAGHHD